MTVVQLPEVYGCDNFINTRIEGLTGLHKKDSPYPFTNKCNVLWISKLFVNYSEYDFTEDQDVYEYKYRAYITPDTKCFTISGVWRNGTHIDSNPTEDYPIACSSIKRGRHVIVDTKYKPKSPLRGEAIKIWVLQ